MRLNTYSVVSISSQQYLGVVLIIAGLLVLVFSNHMVSDHMMSHAMHMHVYWFQSYSQERASWKSACCLVPHDTFQLYSRQSYTKKGTYVSLLYT